MKKQNILPLFLMSLLLCLAPVWSALAQTDLGILHSAEELAIWRQRANGANAINYKSNGADGTPGDFDRIQAYADEFLANPSANLWQGTTVPGSNYPIYEGIKLQQAAFCYQIYKLSNPTLANQYAAAARTALLQQIVIPNTDISKWNLANVGETGVNESRWITRLVFATDYLSDYLSAADKTTLNAWFLNQANFMAAHIQAKEIGQCFPSRLQDNYTIVGRDAKPTGESYGIYISGQYPDGYEYTHVNANGTLGNRIAWLATRWNNRNADKVTMYGMVGHLLNNSNLIFQAKQYAKEWIKYSVYPDGTMGEYERNGDYNLPMQGMAYSAINIWQYIVLAEATARRGDMELYNYSTAEGMHGTQGGAKSIRMVVEKYCKNIQANPAIYFLNTNATNRIDSYDEVSSTELIWDALFCVPNKLWQSSYITSIYTRTAPNMRPYPQPGTSVSSAAQVWYPWGGSGAELPGVLLMAGQLETALRTYATTATVDVPANLRVPYVLQRSTQFVWDHAVGAVSYNLRYRALNTTTWVTLSNQLNTYTPIITLDPGLVWEWQVQAVGASTSSAWSPSSYITTPASCTGNSTVVRELWTNQTGYYIWQTSSLPLAKTPNSTSNLTTLEAAGTGTSNYFTRTRGFVCVPTTGNYTFWISGDDEAELYLSTNDDPANATRIASTKWTNVREFTKYSTQKSASILLVGNQRYYIEVRQTQVGGLDHFSVQWQLPSGTIESPIPGSRISPYMPNQVPTTSITANKANYISGEDIVLSSTPADADGAVIRLDYYLDNTKIGSDFFPPWDYTYANVPAGTYNFRAIAIDNSNTSSVAATITRTVAANVAPTATIAGDKASYVAGENVVLTATGTDTDGSVARIDFYNGTTLLGSDAAAPYSYTVLAPAVGSYTYRAIAVDNLGLASTVVTITRTVVANSAPTTTLVSDKTTYVTGESIMLTATGTDTDGSVSRIDFYNGSTLLGSDASAPYTYTVAASAAGSFTYRAIAVDNLSLSGTAATVSVTVTYPNAIPTVTLTSNKAQYQSPEDIILTSTATDANGTIAEVDFYIDNTLIGTDLTAPYTFTYNSAAAGTYNFRAISIDNQNASSAAATLTLTVSAPTGSTLPSACATGSILREVWTSVSGNGVSLVPTQNPNIAGNITNGFEAPANFADNYGQRLRGYICPPVTGAYTFWIAGDDNAELWLSTTEDSADKARICYTTIWTNAREYTKSALQKSGSITLQAGYRYYIEAVQKEGAGFDNLSVAWQIPGGAYEAPIPATRLSPWAGLISYGCKSSGGITRETWNNVTGDITAVNWTRTPWWRGTNGNMEPSRNINDNYAQRLYGFICPPMSGVYTLKVAGDDQTELWLSGDENPANIQRIAYNYTPTLLREYSKNASQTATVWLSAGRRYYIEARHKEVTGDDFLTVAWTLPNGTLESPIPASRVATFASGAARLGTEEGYLAQGKEAVRLSLYPNPATSSISLVTNTFAGTEWQMSIVSQMGAEVKNLSRTFAQDQFQTEIAIEDLAPGLYILRVKDGQGTLHSLRFSKQN